MVWSTQILISVIAQSEICKTVSIPNFVPPHGAAEVTVLHIFMRICEN